MPALAGLDYAGMADPLALDEGLGCLLLRRGLEQANDTAYAFVSGSGTNEIDWQTLAGWSGALAERMRGSTEPGDRVLILLEPGLPYIAALFGCFLAGAVAVPCYPLRSQRTIDAVLAVAADCTPALALTDTGGVSALARLDDERVARLAVYRVDDVPPPGADRAIAVPADHPVALLQYTSGSTGAPKGVIVTHANLRANLAAQQALYGVDAGSRGVIWLPPYHDMGLGSGILQPLWSGSAILLMAPGFAMQRPLRWLEAIDGFRATVSGAPPFAFAACVAGLHAAVTVGEEVALDLSNWTCAVVGAEPIPPKTMLAFCEAFGPYGFDPSALAPSYGLAEATLLVAGSRGGLTVARVDDDRPITRCGPVIAGHELIAVDPERLTPSDPGKSGEIWVAGSCVAAGYWRKPTATAETFEARLADGRGPYLRTGDLGRIVDGELIVTGRLKNIAIIAGRKVHFEDIENAVRAEVDDSPLQPEIGAIVATELGEDGRERLVLVVEASSLIRSDPEKRAALRQAATRIVARKFDARLHNVLLERRGRLPRTSSGKIRRGELRSLYPAFSRRSEVSVT